MNEKNTFVLDDRSETFSLNKRNGIQIPEFESDMSVEDICNHPDDELLKLMTWLSTDEVKQSKDVRKLNKNDIFNKSATECLESMTSPPVEEEKEKKPRKTKAAKKVESPVKEKKKTVRKKK